jgi:2-dehydro-3-deoxygluconokinase
MLRLASPDGVRLASSRTLDATFGGGEANVAISLARLGVDAAFVTALPDNDLGEAARHFLAGHGVDVGGIVTRPGRLGIYFLEPGAAQRPSRVLYDRAESAFVRCGPEDFGWESLLAGAAWFHTTGITPALSASAAQAAVAGARAARVAGATVSVDLNFRAKLWNWGASAGDVMADLVAEADVLIGNEEDADKVFGIRAAGTSVSEGHVESAGYADVAERLASRFPRLRAIAFTQRGSVSASENDWSGVLWTPDTFVVARTWRIAPIVDRVGSGDAFAAGLIAALTDGLAPQAAIEFAVAAGCLKHSLRGDVNLVSRAEVEALAGGSGSGRVER